jgi:hypothetical protein
MISNIKKEDTAMPQKEQLYRNIPVHNNDGCKTEKKKDALKKE